ncbi:MAG: phosphodiester glycosidase family protein [Deltaproteobacteria bacterium]|nr:phosphodiester glycosidase family protein [Deltaproteobacteria bacterium]
MDVVSNLRRFGCLLIALVGLLVFAISTSGWSAEQNHPAVKLAKVDSRTFDGQFPADDQQEFALPEWLDKLLTSLPGADETDALVNEFAAALRSGDRQGGADSEQAARPEIDTEVTAEPPNRIGPDNQARLESKSEGLARSEEPVDPAFPKPASITPLYTSPVLEGEGVWTTEDLPRSGDGRPLLYKTLYRPSVEYPNAVVYLAVFDMSRLRTRFFIGNTEPGIYNISYPSERESLSKIVAITNAMWMQQHARGAGAVFRRQVVYPMVAGMATLVVYEDDSVDIIEWSDSIPLRLVKDARQLRHLIVKDGLVVERVLKNGKIEDSEIGLGGFLIDNSGQSTMGKKAWFLANRTAFGIREDGNLVFAMGHHVSTKDLAKALILAGCKRAIHGDANIHNIVCNFYFRDERDKIVRRDKLSPEQLKYTLKRYDEGYSKDFFAFYER